MKKVIIISTLILSLLAYLYNNETFIRKTQSYLDLPCKTITRDVLEKEETVREEVKKYTNIDYTNVILAIIMQESKGLEEDIMQSSESLGYAQNTLIEQDSIEQGVKYFFEGLEKSDGDILLAIQGYNFGHGYISFALERDGYFSEENSLEFSNIQKELNGSDKYGDPLYVYHVLSYLEYNIDLDEFNINKTKICFSRDAFEEFLETYSENSQNEI